MNQTRYAVFLADGLLLLLVALTALLVKFLEQMLGFAPIIGFALTVTFGALWGGGRGGLVGLGGTIVAINFFFISPRHALTLDWDDLVRLSFFSIALLVGLRFRSPQSAHKKRTP